MISALLTNSAISSPRGSGMPSDGQREAERETLGRGVDRPDDSAASQQAVSTRSGAVPSLTAEAVLALQALDESKGTDRQRGYDNEQGRGNSSGELIARAGEDSGTAGSASGGAFAAGAQAAGGQAAVPAPSAGGEDEVSDPEGLSKEEKKQVDDLKQRDREVRAHEQAHARAGGAHAGAPSYTFQQGPDGQRYAIGGEVSIDTSSERTPEATIRKMQIVMRAATAPAEPSSQDLKVAQQARSQMAAAQAEARAESAEELQGGDEAASADGEVSPTSAVSSSQAAEEGSGPTSDPERVSENLESDDRDRRSEAEQVSRIYALAGSAQSGSSSIAVVA
ncbi:putative metalloprotease CJM1_0395 family protein [Roseibium algae]|uniref:Metalloprotease CJM1_0395 family protein n=1 Tax=Roseibium algae TaxID=3123038 RepID=A0ABU8TH42_9HYPH